MNNQKLNLNRLESKFKVNYLTDGNATYKSLVNYSMDLKSPVQRWYRYKEGYSEKLVENILNEHKVTRDSVILDPFLGSGTTIVSAQKLGCKTIGYEVNPFSFFLTKVKTQKYTRGDINSFENFLKILEDGLDKYSTNLNISISIVEKLYPKDILDYILRNIDFINRIDFPQKTKDLGKLAILSSLEEISNYRKAGNGLKIRRGKSIKEPTLEYAKKIHNTFLHNIREDLSVLINSKHKTPKLYQKSSLSLMEIKDSSVDGVIFSPPYANCFDYTEIYKVELWFGQFVSSQLEIKGLKKETIRSHLSAVKSDQKCNNKSVELSRIIDQINLKDLWSSKIPKMLFGYFDDMFTLLDSLNQKMKQGGFCVIVVSNSAYGGVVIPTDLILAEYASQNGFKVEKIDVARSIIPSSQQYKKTLLLKQYLRESIITLVKK